MAAKYFPGFEGVAISGYGVSAGGGGVSGVQLSGWARQNTADRPYGVANDYIASTLGLMLGLPIAPVTLIGLGDGAVASVSLGFGERGVRPPPVDLSAVGEGFPEEVAGVVVFDHWVCNQDRHDENLASTPSAGLVAFDHDAALIGHKPPVSAMENLQSGHGAIVKGHPLAPQVKDPKLLDGWVAEVRRLSRRAIGRVAQQAFGARLLTAPERDAVVSMLTYRARHIDAMMESRSEEFTGIAQSRLQGGEES